MKKYTTVLLSTLMLLSVSNVVLAEEASNSTLFPAEVSSEFQGGISIQADQQSSFVSRGYNDEATRYTGAINGRNRMGTFTMSVETMNTSMIAYLLEYNGVEWREVDQVATNITWTGSNFSKDFYMKNGYSYKVKFVAYAQNTGSVSIKNYR